MPLLTILLLFERCRSVKIPSPLETLNSLDDDYGNRDGVIKNLT